MNDKEIILNKVVDIVVACTNTVVELDEVDDEGNPKTIDTITRADLLGKSRNENHVMARSILALQLKHEGYTVTTIALLLGRTDQAVRHLIQAAYNNIESSRVCRKAAAQVVLECEKLYGN